MDSKYSSVGNVQSEVYFSNPEVLAKDEEPDNEQKTSDAPPEMNKAPQIRPCPFHLRWIHGYNPKVDVINLNDKGSTTVFYAACNCGILYNWKTNQMKILQGHSNFVTCIASDRTGRWLVTADSGPDNILTIWDADTCMPCRTLFQPHGHLKISKVALSDDAKYLLTVAYHDKAVLQWWAWALGLEVPHAIIEVDMPRDSIIMIAFNPEESKEFVMISKHDLWIGGFYKVEIDERDRTQDRSIETFEMKVTKPDKKVISEMGVYTSFTFVPTTCQVMVATSGGAVAIYGYTLEYNSNVVATDIFKLKCVKVLKIEKHRINVIKFVDDVIVTGNQIGEIKFYDDQLKLLYWCHQVQVDRVKGISFNISARSYEILHPSCKKYCECCQNAGPDMNPVSGDVHQKLVSVKIPSDATTKSKPFVVRDFIIHTHNQGICFVDFVCEKYFKILDYRRSVITALSVHSERPLFCIGYIDGKIELINFETHRIVSKLDLRDQFKIVIPPKDDSIKSSYEIILPNLSVTCLKYSPSGLHLACGLNDGQLLFLEPTTAALRAAPLLQDSGHAIIQMCYSCDSMTLATSDRGNTVCVFLYNCEASEWRFYSKHRAHYKEVTSLLFTMKKNNDGFYKLVSFGQDRVMIEYDIGSSVDGCLDVVSLDRIEQSAVPLCAVELPDIEGDLSIFITANDEFKYKVINCKTAMTLATFLGPRFEDPVENMMLVLKNLNGGDERYMVFATKKVIGLQKIPMDGNPYKHLGVLCHPKQIKCMNFRDDIDSLFVLGQRDTCVCQWAANYSSVETTTLQGGEDLDPYYCLIEGGRYGWLFQEIRDLFYYIQVLCQGTFSPAIRRVGDYIPIDSLPDIMRALGFFPSEFEVENMLTHAKYDIFEDKPATIIDFEDFVKLYLNHRPAIGETMKRIKNAFRNVSSATSQEPVMSRMVFVDVLSKYGECLPKDQVWYLLSILFENSFDERATMASGDFSFLPKEISFSEFVFDILGISNMDDVSEQHSIVSSMSSQQTGSSTSLRANPE